MKLLNKNLMRNTYKPGKERNKVKSWHTFHFVTCCNMWLALDDTYNARHPVTGNLDHCDIWMKTFQWIVNRYKCVFWHFTVHEIKLYNSTFLPHFIFTDFIHVKGNSFLVDSTFLYPFLSLNKAFSCISLNDKD